MLFTIFLIFFFHLFSIAIGSAVPFQTMGELLATEIELTEFMVARPNITVDTQSGNWTIEDVNGLPVAHVSSEIKTQLDARLRPMEVYT
ncbi:hypothetical protein N7508_004156 [Penicillium antarcticum]|uniref:uncharacterized protein n=1 Tax=Penicillium antarcticum TaxID=416450 RepID=UPI002395F7D3|nr:uncharacterized protein N7508_004156 [Penicillium antarcticum]KAJ5308777.1 hypothetical protein N7508_004156 [Penicillium antarcticum]